VAAPSPVTASFTWLGVYSATWQPAAAASAMTTPLACATAMAVRTFVWKNTRSIDSTWGSYSRISDRTSRWSSASRSASGAVGGVRRTPAAWARAAPRGSASTHA
jgi:hypothetical protein